jgi:hypothetical protein
VPTIYTWNWGKKLRGKILKVRHQYNIYMKLRKKATRENVKSAPPIYTWNWGKKLRGKILKVRQQYIHEIEEKSYEGKY